MGAAVSACDETAVLRLAETGGDSEAVPARNTISPLPGWFALCCSPSRSAAQTCERSGAAALRRRCGVLCVYSSSERREITSWDRPSARQAAGHATVAQRGCATVVGRPTVE